MACPPSSLPRPPEACAPWRTWTSACDLWPLPAAQPGCRRCCAAWPGCRRWAAWPCSGGAAARRRGSGWATVWGAAASCWSGTSTRRSRPPIRKAELRSNGQSRGVQGRRDTRIGSEWLKWHRLIIHSKIQKWCTAIKESFKMWSYGNNRFLLLIILIIIVIT